MVFSNSAFSNCCEFLNTLQPRICKPLGKYEDFQEDQWRALYFDGSQIRYNERYEQEGKVIWRVEASFEPSAFQKIEYIGMTTVSKYIASYVYIYLSPQPLAVGIAGEKNFEELLSTIQLPFSNKNDTHQDRQDAHRFINLWNSAF